jgi:predicted esterase
MIPAAMTAQLVEQLQDRGASVTVLPHPGGHSIDPSLLPGIKAILAGSRH